MFLSLSLGVFLSIKIIMTVTEHVYNVLSEINIINCLNFSVVKRL